MICRHCGKLILQNKHGKWFHASRTAKFFCRMRASPKNPPQMKRRKYSSLK